MSEPQPMIGDGEWHVCAEARSDCIWVGPVMGCLECDRGNNYVEPPNRLERLFGITFESKIERAIQKCQKYCDRENALIKIVEEEAAKIVRETFEKWKKEAIR